MEILSCNFLWSYFRYAWGQGDFSKEATAMRIRRQRAADLSKKINHFRWCDPKGIDRLTNLNLVSGLPGGSDSKAYAYNAGDLASIPGSGRFLGEGNWYPFQYACLENPMDRGAWRATIQGVAKNQTQLRDYTFIFDLKELTACHLELMYLFVTVRCLRFQIENVNEYICFNILHICTVMFIRLTNESFNI